MSHDNSFVFFVWLFNFFGAFLGVFQRLLTPERQGSNQAESREKVMIIFNSSSLT